MARKTTGAKTAALEAESAEVTRRCLELRLAGGTLEAIGRTVGIDKSNVSRRIRAAIAEIPKSEAGELRALENERLDVMLVSIWKQVRDGHLGAVDRAVRISERRARLNGIDAPQRVDLGSRTVDIDGVARDLLVAIERNAGEAGLPGEPGEGEGST